MSDPNQPQERPFFKLGKGPAKRDDRTLKFAAFLRAPVPVPPEYDFDSTHPGIPTPVYQNDAYRCCVISGRAHQTLRFEDLEQGRLIPITDQDVLSEYWLETNKDHGRKAA